MRKCWIVIRAIRILRSQSGFPIIPLTEKRRRERLRLPSSDLRVCEVSHVFRVSVLLAPSTHVPRDVGMTDAEIWQAFVHCERRWLSVLTKTRALHSGPLGKQLTPIQWLPERSRGSCGWLGFYWQSPPFWFGFGPHGGAWLPLIECDVARCKSAFVDELEAKLGGAWRGVDRRAGRYWRLWAPASCEGKERTQVEWFAARSRELDEFTVS